MASNNGLVIQFAYTPPAPAPGVAEPNLLFNERITFAKTSLKYVPPALGMCMK